MKKFESKTVLSLAAALAAVLCGCASQGVQPHSYEIRVDSSLKDASMEIHAIGVNPVESARFAEMSISDYWKAGNPVRMSNTPQKVKFNFPSSGAMKLSSNSPIWAQWMSRGATDIVFITDLPGDYEDKRGNSDRRRIILPPDSSCWEGDFSDENPIIIDVGPNGIISVPVPVGKIDK